MIYIGHFYFDGQGIEGEGTCGHFTCLAEADNVEIAVQKFKDHIYELRDSEVLFDGEVSIFLDDIVEIRKVPDKAIAIDFISSGGEDPSCLDNPIPPENLEGCAIYDWVPDGYDNEGEDIEPFVEFECKHPDHNGKRERRHLRVVK